MSYFGRLSAFLGILRMPNYGVYTAGNAISLIGTWVQRVATGWLAWELTQSGTWLGIIAFADLFPTVVVGPFAGALADRTDRLRLTQISQSAACGIAVMLFVLSASDAIGIYSLFALTLASGIVMAINQPARLALISSLVPRSHLPAAVAMNSIVFNVARFLGPMVAGITIALAGVAAAFAINAVSFAVFVVALTRVRVESDERTIVPDRTFLAQLAEGYRYAASHRGIAAVFVLMVATAVGARPVVELLPGFSDVVFGAGATGLAVLTSSIGIGSVIAGLWLGGRAAPERTPRTVVFNAALLGLAILGFVSVDVLWMAVLILLVAGFAMACCGIGSQTMVHLAVAPEMRGRILSIHGVIFRGGPAVGALLMGSASETLGLRPALAIGAGVVLATVAWTVVRFQSIAETLDFDTGTRP